MLQERQAADTEAGPVCAALDFAWIPRPDLHGLHLASSVSLWPQTQLTPGQRQHERCCSGRRIVAFISRGVSK